MNRRRIAIALGVALAGVGLWATWSVYSVSKEVDVCTARIDPDAIAAPTVQAKIRGAAEVEVVFVRPGSSTDWIRVGLALKRTATVTPELVVLALSRRDLPSCRFLPDYQRDVPFGSVGAD